MNADLPAPPPGATTSPFGSRRYAVFCSYSHADTKWARWLLKRLENFRVPARFHGAAAPIGTVGPRLAPVFRDRDELPAAQELGETILEALRRSATLVVICSPGAARSRWVNEEILAFKRLGGAARIFALVVDGVPGAADPAQQCFPPALRFALGPDGALSSTPLEVIAADARPAADGREDAFVRLVAGLLGVGFDDLRRRELQRRYRRMTWIAVGSVAGMAVTGALAALAYLARSEAVIARGDADRRQEQSEELITFMLSDARTQLNSMGKLEVLEKIGAKTLAYFQSLNPRDLTDTTLARQAEALGQIGEIRVQQLRYADALAAFTTALARAHALAARHPADGDLLFQRAQSEYWIGFVHRRRGEVPAARDWFTRYRQTADALVLLDPKKIKWRREVAYGHHNLAVLELDAARLAPARAGFLAEIDLLKRILAAQPADLELQFELANAHSYLGTASERDGRLAEALAQFTDYIASVEALVRAEPAKPRWRARLADALALQSSLLAITGHREASRTQRNQARLLLEALVAADPRNRASQRALQGMRLKEAKLLRADGDPAAALRVIADARAPLADLAAAEPADTEVNSLLALAHRLRAEILEPTDLAAAAEAAARGVEFADKITAHGAASDNFASEAARTLLAAGAIAARGGARATAEQHWRRALALLAPRLPGSNYWIILDSAARAHALLGDGEKSRALRAQLLSFGYQPLEPWPAERSP